MNFLHGFKEDNHRKLTLHTSESGMSFCLLLGPKLKAKTLCLYSENISAIDLFLAMNKKNTD